MKSYKVIRMNDNQTATIIMDIAGKTLQQDVPVVGENEELLTTKEFQENCAKVINKFESDLEVAAEKAAQTEKSPVLELIGDDVKPIIVK